MIESIIATVGIITAILEAIAAIFLCWKVGKEVVESIHQKKRASKCDA